MTKHKFRITNIDKERKDWVSRIWDNGFVDKFPECEHLDFYNKYLGKSKVSIKDLFEADDTTSTNIIDRNIRKENMRLQAEINRLREALKSQIKALVALKGFYPETYLFADDNIRRIKEALNGESEEK